MNADLLIPASGGEEGAIIIPREGLDHIAKPIKLLLFYTMLHIPQFDCVIRGGGGEDIGGRGMEEDMPHLAVAWGKG